MKFDVFTQDITIEEINKNDGVAFINELGLEGDALKQALNNYFEKCILAFAQTKDLFAVNENVVLYYDKNTDTNDYTITVRKPFENKRALLTIDIVNMTISVTVGNGEAVKTKTFEKTTKLTDVVKAFNQVIKTIQK